jgi:hypothetical protein
MKIIKNLLILGLVLGVLAQNKPVCSAEAESKQQIQLGQLSIKVKSEDEILENSLYLPDDCKIPPMERIDKQKAIKLLKYLCTFQSALKKGSPFMKSEQAIFDQSLEADIKVQWGFNKGLKLVIVTSLISFVGLVSLHPDISPAQAICIISAASAVVTAIGQYIAFKATGNIPDEASQKANLKQNLIARLKESYIRLARVWVDIYFSNQRELAIEIADNMDRAFANLIVKFTEKVDYEDVVTLLRPIKEVMCYILNPQNEKLGISPLICDYIERRESQLGLIVPNIDVD